MKLYQISILFSVIFVFISCGSKLGQATPEKTVQSIFDAANSGDISHLTHLWNTENWTDQDVQKISNCEQLGANFHLGFKKCFGKGQIVAIKVEGNLAEEHFNFGPFGKQNISRVKRRCLRNLKVRRVDLRVFSERKSNLNRFYEAN